MIDIIEVSIFPRSALAPFILGFCSRAAVLQPRDIWLNLSLERAVCPVSRIVPALFVCTWFLVQAESFATSHQKESRQSKAQPGRRAQQCTCFVLGRFAMEMNSGAALWCCLIVL